MALARKLESGSWQTRATKVINGKKVTKCFTVHPKQCKGDSRKAKQLSEKLAREWQIETSNESIYSPTMAKCMRKYIDENQKHFSDRTVYDYENYIKFFDPIKDILMEDVRSSDLQLLVNEWSVSVKSKTIKNRISFILSTLDYCGYDRKIRLRYPENDSIEVGSPDTKDIQILLANSSGALKAIIALAAIPGMRRGEIAALKEGDISRDMCKIFIHADMVYTKEGWKYKDRPKTKSGKRTVDLPQYIIDLLPYHENPDNFVFELNPNQMSKLYDKLRFRFNINHTLHGLRHYAISFRSDIGINPKYIQEIVGHEIGSDVTEKVYNNPIESTRRHYLEVTNDYLDKTFKSTLIS